MPRYANKPIRGNLRYQQAVDFGLPPQPPAMWRQPLVTALCYRLMGALIPIR
jgi:hypothetical protein